MGIPAIMDDVEKALRLEALARRGREGGERIRLLGGKRVDSNGTARSYQFMTEGGSVWLREDEAVHLATGKADLLAVVTGWDKKRRVTLSVREDLGLRVDHAVIIRDDMYLIEALRRRLELARAGSIPLNWGLINQLLSPTQWIRTPVTAPIDAPGHLNLEQRDAVAAMGIPGVAVIWGPPGTGKTSTVATGICQAWRRGQTVFALANTNIASDNLLERTLDALGSDVRDGDVIRIGEIHSPSLQERYGDQVSWEAVVQRRREPLERRQIELGREIAEVRRSLLECGRETNALGQTSAHLRERLGRLSEEAAQVEREHDGVPATVLKEARITGTTIHRAYLPGYLRDQADMVVIDEASMLPFPMAMFGAGLARKTAVLAGDPRQLGTIVKSRNNHVRKVVGSSVFHPPTVRDRARIESASVLLRRQYRMDPEIAELVNELSYGNDTLITPRCVRDRDRLRLPLLPGAVCYVDTSEFESEATIPNGTHTRVNDTHARIVAALVRGIGSVPKAVITPYWGQKRAIKTVIPAEYQSSVTVDTVHRYQGSECEVVILDLPDAPQAPVGHFMRAVRADQAGARLLTVGISRARRHLVVVANFKHLAAATTKNTYAQRLLALLESNATPVQVDDLDGVSSRTFVAT